MPGQLGNQGGSALVQRACTLQVGSLSIPAGQGVGLDIEFTVRRGLHITKGSLKPQPNTCDLKIYGLNATHRKQLASSTGIGASGKPGVIPCVLTAGYTGHSSVIFAGELRSANNVTEGPNKVTELTTGDGDQALAQARLNIAIAAGTSASSFLDTLLSALGVSAENLQQARQLLTASPAAGQLFSKGAVLKGSAAEIMSDFARSTGLTWSLQNGKLLLLPLGLPDDAVAISIADAPGTGLIGSPTVDVKGILSFETLMIPDLVPGRKLVLDTLEVKGNFIALSVQTTGGTLGNDWKNSVEASRY